MAFNGLPNELITQILEFTVADSYRIPEFPEDIWASSPIICGVRTLHALCLSSRLLRELAEPLLYEVFKQSHPRQVPLFLRTVIDRPDLAERVKHVNLRARSNHKTKGLIDMKSFSAADMNLFSSAVSRLCCATPPMSDQDVDSESCMTKDSSIKDAATEGWESDSSDDWESASYDSYRVPEVDPEDPDVWYRCIKVGKWDAIVGALIPLLSNLQHIHFDCFPIHDEDPSGYIQRMAFRAVRIQSDTRTASDSILALRSLHAVELTSGDGEGESVEADLQDMLPFFELPSVTRIIGNGLVDEDWARQPSPAFPTTELYLNNCALGMDSLASLIGCTPGLEKFNYHHSGRRGEYFHIIFAPHELEEVMKPLTNSLQELSMFSRKVCSQHLELSDWRLEAPIGSLANFQRLTYICMSAWIMVGQDPKLKLQRSLIPTVSTDLMERPFRRLADAVPKSLEILELTECEPYVLEHVAELLEQKEQKTPKLKKITLIRPDTLRHFDIDDGRNRVRHIPRTEEETAEGKRLVAQAAAKGVTLAVRFFKSKDPRLNPNPTSYFSLLVYQHLQNTAPFSLTGPGL
jgi:hypothetical protein